VKKLVLAAALALSTASAMAADQEQNVVKQCVNVVHNMRPSNPYMRDLYKSYDAYYVPSTQTISDFGNKEPRYFFQKCMAEHGYPIELHVGAE
jgi:opacity protein-like surface antigen